MRRVLLVAVVALGGWQPFRAPDRDVAAGTEAYAQGRYDDAIAAYERAEQRGAVDADGLAYDRGTAELAAAGKLADPAAKKAMTQQAFEHLKQATHARDPRMRGAAHYNEGNALMAGGKLEDAIEQYKDALREDPSSDDARVNLEVALRRRQKQQGQQAQPQPQPQPQPPQPGSGAQQPQAATGSGGQQPPPQAGSGAQQPQAGSGARQPPPQAGSGQPPPQAGSGAQQPQAGSGQPQPPPQAGSGQPQPNASQSGDPSQSGQPGDPTGNDPNRNGKPRHGAHAQHGDSPRSPTDRKLDDLEDYSRRLQRDQARDHATGHEPDPEHDW
jgi:predicted negative regulator of RcsB-dependent stress response